MVREADTLWTLVPAFYFFVSLGGKWACENDHSKVSLSHRMCSLEERMHTEGLTEILYPASSCLSGGQLSASVTDPTPSHPGGSPPPLLQIAACTEIGSQAHRQGCSPFGIAWTLPLF